MGFDEDDSLKLVCIECGSWYEPDPWLHRCPRCGGLLDVVYEDLSYKRSLGCRGVWRYRGVLPRVRVAVSLGEGGTPLIKLRSIDRGRVYVKFEGVNPTGSFKDRGMAVAVSLAKSVGAKAVVAASTGNTSASAAAYAARAGLKSIVVLPKGKVARGKLFQALLHGASIIEIEGSFDSALESVMKATEESSAGLWPVNSFNPWRLEGQKTIAYEIYEDLGGAPDYVIVPVGNAGNIWAIWKGFKELAMQGLIDKPPVMIGVQSEGASPIASMLSKGLKEPEWVEKPETIATAIRIGRPVNWKKALMAVTESKGTVLSVSDREILEAQWILARREGLGVEPASAASMAGLRRLAEQGMLDKDSTYVLIATGHALKDPGIPVEARSFMARSPDDAVNILRKLAESR